MYELNDETKASLENITGLDIKSLQNIEFEDELAYVENVIKKPLSFKKYDIQTLCGNPLIALGRFKTIEEVNNRLKRIKRNN